MTKPPVKRRPAKQPATISTADYRRLAAFRHALRRFLAFSETAARASGLTPQQHQALLAIKGAVAGDTATIGYLADQLLLAPNSAAELADRMVKSGLLTRAEAGDDRRRVMLSLTPSAEAALHGLSASHLRELRYAAPVLDGLLQSLKPIRAARATAKKPPRRR